jgi:hypothetical protein
LGESSDDGAAARPGVALNGHCRLPLPLSACEEADVAQLAERVLGKDEVSSSILDIGSTLRSPPAGARVS